jgi:hypothetical protein
MTVTVQPTLQFKTAVFVATNDHYAVDEKATEARPAMDRMTEVFDESIERSDAIVDRVRRL